MKKSALPLFVLITIALTGCHGGHSLDGKWSTDLGGTPTTIEFSGGSKILATAEVKGSAMPMTMTMTGTYSMSGDTMTVHFTDISAKTTDASKQALLDAALAPGKAGQLADMNKDPSSKVSWTSDDEVVMTDSKGKAQTMKRVKS